GHVPSFYELHLLVKAVSISAASAAFVWAMYLAIEPQIRRSWPDSLISWSRMQRGRFHDPLVASHLLAGTLVMTMLFAFRLTMARFAPAVIPLPASLTSLNSVPFFTANVLGE